MSPFFSIGVTTGSPGGIRLDMLRECLASLLASVCEDYEVVIGNDCPTHALTPEEIGIRDPRIRILNHPENVGEMKNMNAVLEASRGQYFTWLADDDLHSKRFLSTVRGVIEWYGAPSCVLTLYAQGGQYPEPEEIPEATMLSGADYLREYLAGRIRILSCYGVFRVDEIRALGGMARPHPGYQHYSDNWLALKISSLARVAFVRSPLVFFRTHAGSESTGSTDVGAYLACQKALLSETKAILEGPGGNPENTRLLLEWFVRDYLGVMQRSGRLQLGKLAGYGAFVLGAAGGTGLPRVKLGAFFGRQSLGLFWKMTGAAWRERIIGPLARCKQRFGPRRMPTDKAGLSGRQRRDE